MLPYKVQRIPPRSVVLRTRSVAVLLETLCTRLSTRATRSLQATPHNAAPRYHRSCPCCIPSDDHFKNVCVCVCVCARARARARVCVFVVAPWRRRSCNVLKRIWVLQRHFGARAVHAFVRPPWASHPTSSRSWRKPNGVIVTGLTGASIAPRGAAVGAQQHPALTTGHEEPAAARVTAGMRRIAAHAMLVAADIAAEVGVTAAAKLTKRVLLTGQSTGRLSLDGTTGAATAAAAAARHQAVKVSTGDDASTPSRTRSATRSRLASPLLAYRPHDRLLAACSLWIREGRAPQLRAAAAGAGTVEERTPQAAAAVPRARQPRSRQRQVACPPAGPTRRGARAPC